MKKQIRLILLAMLVVVMVVMTAVVASADDTADGSGIALVGEEIVGNYSVETDSGYTSTNTLAEAIGVVKNGGAITLLKDVEEAAGVQLNVNKTYTITGANAGADYKLTFTGTTAFDGGYNPNNKGAATAYALDVSAGNVTFDNLVVVAPRTAGVIVLRLSGADAEVTLNNVITDGGHYTIAYYATATLNIKGADTVLGTGSNHQYILHSTVIGEGAVLNMYNGKVTNKQNGYVTGNSTAGGDIMLFYATKFEFNLMGGTVESAGDGFWCKNGMKLTVSEDIPGVQTVVTSPSGTVLPDGSGSVINISGGTFTINGGNAANSVLNVRGAGTTVSVSGGTFNGGSIALGGGIGAVQISGGTFSSPAAAVSAENLAGGFLINCNNAVSLTISGGTFRATGANSYSAVLRISDGGANVRITGGTFEMSGPGDVVRKNNGTLTIEKGGAVAPSFTALSGTGTAVLTIEGSNGVTTINDGVFTNCSSTTYLLNLHANNAVVNINGGTFNSYAWNSITVRNRGMKLTVDGGVFESKGAGGYIFCSNDANTIEIKDGTFKAPATTSDISYQIVYLGAYDNKLIISGGKFIGGKRQIDMDNKLTTAPTGASVVISGGEFGADGVAVYGCIISGNNGSFSAGTNVQSTFDRTIEITGGIFTLPNQTTHGMFNCNGIHYEISGGTFTVPSDVNIGKGIFSMNDNDHVSDVTVTGGTFTIHGSGNVFCYDANKSGSASSTVDRPCGSLTVTGGTFINDNPASGAALFSFWSGKDLPDAEGKYASITITGGRFQTVNRSIFSMNIGSSVQTVTVTGGLFVISNDEPVGFVYVSGGECARNISFTGGAFLSKAPTTIYGEDVITDSMPQLSYAGVAHYAFIMNVPATFAPAMTTGTQVRLTAGSEGIRFTSTISASAIAGLGGTVSYGTIIAPLDMVAAAGNFTKAALDAYATAKGYATSKVYVDVPAVYSVDNVDGGVTFNAVLVNIKEANYDRAFAAIAYAKVGETYYYAEFNAEENARSLADAVDAALTDISVEPEGEYVYPVDGGYSCYSDSQRAKLEALKASISA
ncbi:MAG: hypothetical protein E7663_03975 [Ruminococcaceae bacterium]|nr:hypothetical protein [Oscillospiraceae bacterium]